MHRRRRTAGSCGNTSRLSAQAGSTSAHSSTLLALMAGWQGSVPSPRAHTAHPLGGDSEHVVSTDNTTRGSRCTLRSFCRIPRCPLTMSSPSRPTHTMLICGLPSGLIVARWPSRPEVMISRTFGPECAHAAKLGAGAPGRTTAGTPWCGNGCSGRATTRDPRGRQWLAPVRETGPDSSQLCRLMSLCPGATVDYGSVGSFQTTISKYPIRASSSS
jgi:hypothetical protein